MDFRHRLIHEIYLRSRICKSETRKACGERRVHLRQFLASVVRRGVTTMLAGALSSAVGGGKKLLPFLSLLSKIMVDMTYILPFMELSLKQAKLAFDRLEVPVGCVIVENGVVIASGCNQTSETRNATRHAEMEAIDILLEQWQKEGLDCSQVAQRFSTCDLYVTCEPCIMCAAALSILGFREVYYGCSNDKFGGCGSILSLHEGASTEFSSEARSFKVTGGILSSEAITLLRSFYEQGNPNAPKPHRPVQVSKLQLGGDSPADH